MQEYMYNQNLQSRGSTTLPTPPPTATNAAKCGFWCKGFKILKGVVTAIAPPIGAALYLADEAFDISGSLETKDQERTAQRGGENYIQLSQQVRSGKLNIGL
jgi:hypothetical protein